MLWIDTASVIVSTSPELLPVMSIRKLYLSLVFEFLESIYTLSKPTSAIFLPPYSAELLDELSR